MPFFIYFLVLFIVSGSLWHIEARNPYEANIFFNAEKSTVTASTITNLVRDLKTSDIQKDLSGYTNTSPIALKINLRGIDVISAFAANSTTLTVFFPQVNINESFTGTTRDQSLTLFKDFLQNNRNEGKRLRRAQAALTPIDPIAGNPNSLMAQMAQGDYRLGRLSPLAGCSCDWSAQPVNHLFNEGVNIGRSFCEFDTSYAVFPYRYSYSPDRDWAFIIDAPQAALVNGRAFSYNGTFALALRAPLAKWWSLTSIVRGGLGLAIDLSTGGAFVSTALTSNMQWCFGDILLAVTNSASYIASTPLHGDGVNFDYHLQNYVFKNGITISTCNGLLGYRTVNLQVYYLNSDFKGRKLFIENYNDVGASIIFENVNPWVCYDVLKVGGTYQFGQKGYKSYALNIDYQF